MLNSLRIKFKIKIKHNNQAVRGKKSENNIINTTYKVKTKSKAEKKYRQ